MTMSHATVHERRRHALLVALLYSLISAATGEPPSWKNFAEFIWPTPSADRVERMQIEQAHVYKLHLQEPENPVRLKALAAFHFNLGEYNQAAAMYLRLYEVAPANADAVMWYGACLYQAKSPDPALRIFETLAAREDSDPVSATLQAEIYFRKGAFMRARKVLERVLVHTEAQADDPAYGGLRERVRHNLDVVQARMNEQE